MVILTEQMSGQKFSNERGNDMKNKKRLLIIGSAAVLLILIIFGGIQIYKYNTMIYRIGIGKRADKRVETPFLTYGANSNFGTSEKAMKKGEEIMKEWHEKVANLYFDLSLAYSEDKEHTLKVEYGVVDGKTEVHLFGEGIPNGETEKRVIDERVLLNYRFELDKDVVY